MQIIDLSTTIQNNHEISIEYVDHARGAKQIERMVDVPAELLRDEEGWAIESFTRFGTHSSTHIDAPWHYNSRIEGKPAPSVDQLPLEWFYSDGVVLEMRHKKDGDAVTVTDIQQELERIDYRLKPLDIVMVRNGQDQYCQDPDYKIHGCGVTADATRWLYQQGIRVMGIDAWGWDAPLHEQAKKAVAEARKNLFWEAHQAGVPYCQIERLVNLAPLPPHGFKVACFPLKIKNGSGAPARVVAMIPD